jgi:hypothetical protein
MLKSNIVVSQKYFFLTNVPRNENLSFVFVTNRMISVNSNLGTVDAKLCSVMISSDTVCPRTMPPVLSILCSLHPRMLHPWRSGVFRNPPSLTFTSPFVSFPNEKCVFSNFCFLFFTVYGQTHSTKLHQPIDELTVCPNLISHPEYFQSHTQISQPFPRPDLTLYMISQIEQSYTTHGWIGHSVVQRSSAVWLTWTRVRLG